MNYQDIAKAKAETKNKNKQTLCAIMEALGITSLEVEFDGSGDSGQVNGVNVYPQGKQTAFEQIQTKVFRTACFYSSAGNRIEEQEEECAADDLAADFAYDVLEFKHSGWEINDGAFGTIVINANGSGRIDYNQRITETEYEESEF